MRDWADHMTTAFPEVRMKKFLEMRGADSGPWNRICALPAFWVGLLYDDAALDAAWDLVKDFSLAERHALRDGVPKHALKLPFRGGTVRDLAREAVKIAIGGLRRRARLNGKGVDEAGFLDALVEIVEANETSAERKLALFNALVERLHAVYAISPAIAQRGGVLRGQFQAQGISRSAPDMLIAATAIEHQLILATRNVRDFLGCGVQVVNPFYIA